jgi:3-dehydroquinate synthase
VKVELGERSYDVVVGEDALDRLGDHIRQLAAGGRVVVISDSTVASLYGEHALSSLRAGGLDASLLSFPAGEPNKTLATASSLFDRLFALHPPIDRDSVVVALGGGVPGDMAGFVAATALRGLRWVQCPTTLLADVDASVGGKTGVDHAAGKNLIGAFHQPRGVFIDVRTLRTLDDVQLRSGLAECVKHAMIRDKSLLAWIDERAGKISEREAESLAELIARNVEIKASVVAADERESGVRAHLNFGHTIGHGIEAQAGYGAITHGQAVALGMIAACRIAERRGLVDVSLRERLASLLDALGLDTRREGLDADAIWRIMQHDKKARAGKVRFVLPTAPGEVDLFDDVEEPAVREAIANLG